MPAHSASATNADAARILLNSQGDLSWESSNSTINAGRPAKRHRRRNHVNRTDSATRSDATSDALPPANRLRSGNQNSQADITCQVDDVGRSGDALVAQKICVAISKAVAQIEETGLLSWRSDLEALKPEGTSFRTLDEALQSCADKAVGSIEELDRACIAYNSSLQYRAAMTWLIRCFLEITRRHFHRRVRKPDVVTTRKLIDERQQRLRVGDLMIAITRPLYRKHGSKAYKLYALLAD